MKPPAPLPTNRPSARATVDSGQRMPPRLPLVALLVSVVLTGTAPGQAQWDERFDRFPTLDGEIRDLAVFHGELYAGGQFSAIGELQTHHIARWDGVRWLDVGGGLPSNGQVHCLYVAGDSLYVGGWFHRVGNTAARNVAVWDGTRWSALGLGVPSGVQALVRCAGMLVAATPYMDEQTRPTQFLHAWTGPYQTWAPLEWWGLESAEPRALLSWGGSVLVIGGRFRFPGDSRSYGVIAGAMGGWSPLGSGLPSDAPPLWDSRPRGIQGVHDLALFQGRIYATGNFVNEAQGTYGLAVYESGDWLPLPSRGTGMSFAQSGGRLYVAGAMDHQMAPDQYDALIAGWDGVQWRAEEQWEAGQPSADPFALAAVDWGGSLIVGRTGGASWYGDPPSLPVARWDGSLWRSLLPGEGIAGSVGDLHSFDGRLIAAGNFLSAGTVAANNVAAWDGMEWAPMGHGLPETDVANPWPWQPQIPSLVRSLATYQGSLVAGGQFGLNAQAGLRNVARFDGAGWRALGDGIAAVETLRTNVGVYDLVEWSARLVAAGEFQSAGTVAVSDLATWDGADWQSTPPGTVGDIDQYIAAVAVHEGDLIAGGIFHQIGGLSTDNIARWDGLQWLPMGGGIQGEVLALGHFRGDLIAGGHFEQAGGTTTNSIARWNGSTWEDLGGLLYPGQPGSGVGWVSAMLPTQDGLLVAGGFTRAGSVEASHLARWGGTAWEPVAAGAPPLGYPSSFPGWGGPYHAHRGSLAAGPGGLYCGSPMTGSWRGLKLLNIDVPVRAVAVTLEARLIPAGVQLAWEIPASVTALELRLERTVASSLTEVVASWRGAGSHGSWTDTSTPRGGVCRYRAVANVAGVEVRSTEVVVDLSGPRAAAGLRPAIVTIEPNPCNPRTTVHVELSGDRGGTLQIVNAAGRRVWTKNLRGLTAGSHAVQWGGLDDAGRAVASGAYVVVLQTDVGADARRITVVK